VFEAALPLDHNPHNHPPSALAALDEPFITGISSVEAQANTVLQAFVLC
jgi:hypothetical protein